MLNFLDKSFLDNLTQQLFDALPDSMRQVPEDLHNELKAVLAAAFSRLDLVTKEEFDIQTKVLQATRARVEALEKVLESRDNKSCENE